MAKYEACFKEGRYKQQIDKGGARAKRLGISGIPSFILAAADPYNPRKAKGVSFVLGVHPFGSFQKEIEQGREAYRQRVPVKILSSRDHFHEELIRILSDNDASRMGAGYPGPNVQ